MVMPSQCPICGSMMSDCRQPYGCEVCNPPIPDSILRCEITGNPCGTDTWGINHPCQCKNCQVYINDPDFLIDTNKIKEYRLEDFFSFYKENLE
jgi:hypothetical protein